LRASSANEVGCHRKEPRAFTGQRVLAEGAQEHLLRDLVGPVAITQPPRQVPHERCVIGLEEPFQFVVTHVYCQALISTDSCTRRHLLEPRGTHLDRHVLS
jgi:hypothetical protein